MIQTIWSRPDDRAKTQTLTYSVCHNDSTHYEYVTGLCVDFRNAYAPIPTKCIHGKRKNPNITQPMQLFEMLSLCLMANLTQA